MNNKDFKGVSIRGYAAYSICCLENSLLYFNLHDDDWKYLLEKLWRYTLLPQDLHLGNTHLTCPREIRDIESLMYFCSDALPYNVMREVEGKKSPSENRIDTMTEDEINLLYKLYKDSKEIIIEILRLIYTIFFAEWNGGQKYPTYLTMEAMKKLLEFMEGNHIPLPDIQKFKKYVFGADNKLDDETYGLPFNGKEELSKILN